MMIGIWWASPRIFWSILGYSFSPSKRVCNASVRFTTAINLICNFGTIAMRYASWWFPTLNILIDRAESAPDVVWVHCSEMYPKGSFYDGVIYFHRKRTVISILLMVSFGSNLIWFWKAFVLFSLISEFIYPSNDNPFPPWGLTL